MEKVNNVTELSWIVNKLSTSKSNDTIEFLKRLSVLLKHALVAEIHPQFRALLSCLNGLTSAELTLDISSFEALHQCIICLAGLAENNPVLRRDWSSPAGSKIILWVISGFSHASIEISPSLIFSLQSFETICVSLKTVVKSHVSKPAVLESLISLLRRVATLQNSSSALTVRNVSRLVACCIAVIPFSQGTSESWNSLFDRLLAAMEYSLFFLHGVISKGNADSLPEPSQLIRNEPFSVLIQPVSEIQGTESLVENMRDQCIMIMDCLKNLLNPKRPFPVAVDVPLPSILTNLQLSLSTPLTFCDKPSKSFASTSAGDGGDNSHIIDKNWPAILIASYSLLESLGRIVPGQLPLYLSFISNLFRSLFDDGLNFVSVRISGYEALACIVQALSANLLDTDLISPSVLKSILADGIRPVGKLMSIDDNISSDMCSLSIISLNLVENIYISFGSFLSSSLRVIIESTLIAALAKCLNPVESGSSHTESSADRPTINERMGIWLYEDGAPSRFSLSSAWRSNVYLPVLIQTLTTALMVPGTTQTALLPHSLRVLNSATMIWQVGGPPISNIVLACRRSLSLLNPLVHPIGLFMNHRIDSQISTILNKVIDNLNTDSADVMKEAAVLDTATEIIQPVKSFFEESNVSDSDVDVDTGSSRHDEHVAVDSRESIFSHITPTAPIDVTIGHTLVKKDNMVDDESDGDGDLPMIVDLPPDL